MKADKKRILEELEQMLATQIMESIEVDVSAEQIYEKFIKPAMDLAEIKQVDFKNKIQYGK